MRIILALGQELVHLPSSERKLRKNALCLNQSAFSNFAPYVIKKITHGSVLTAAYTTSNF